MTDNIELIRKDLTDAPIDLCPERAYLVTEFYKHHDNVCEPVVVRKARALRYVLENKSVVIFPGELIAGNIGGSRRSCILQPELASTYMSEELLWINRRRTNPFRASLRDRLRLAFRVIPYWVRHSMPTKTFPGVTRASGYIKHQLRPTFYLINEAGGIGHFLPGYERMLALGTSGFKDLLSQQRKKVVESSLDERRGSRRIEGVGYRSGLLDACVIACEALEAWADRIADEADRMASSSCGDDRRIELEEIARTCRKVPRQPAETFREALQSLWLTHAAINLESLNSAVSFGRMDQYLYPYYKRDLAEGRLTREEALDLLLAFSAKTCEHFFLLSERISQYHGGFLIVQAATVGGTDSDGEDSTNELTYLMLDVMERHRMRDPNYLVRLHPGSPEPFVRRALDVARQGCGVPALFNDSSITLALTTHGFSKEDALDYGIVGCVEPSIPGRSFLSTDAGLFNLPICLELALNEGRRSGGMMTVGVKSQPAEQFRDLSDVVTAFKLQLDHQVDEMIRDFHMVENGNINYSPTPLSSMLVEGCIESGRDLTEGGAVYNSSGIQGVGVADVADSLAALEAVVFNGGDYSMGEVLEALRADFKGREPLRAELLKAEKFGNDHARVDEYADLVVRLFHDSLARHTSQRGGRYVPGFYSVTCHVAFGGLTGALPSGRRAGEPFASSIGAAGGCDRLGPTALLNSVASLDSSLMANGNALNLRFDPADVEGEHGLDILEALVKGFFSEGGMEVQLNVLDPETLEDALRHPGKYPELVVRVAGYCAYFDDLPRDAKVEIINRTRLKV